MVQSDSTQKILCNDSQTIVVWKKWYYSVKYFLNEFHIMLQSVSTQKGLYDDSEAILKLLFYSKKFYLLDTWLGRLESIVDLQRLLLQSSVDPLLQDWCRKLCWPSSRHGRVPRWRCSRRWCCCRRSTSGRRWRRRKRPRSRWRGRDFGRPWFFFNRILNVSHIFIPFIMDSQSQRFDCSLKSSAKS